MSQKTERILRQLRDYESRNVTFIQPDGKWPIVWERARGVHVWDADGRKYLDLTAAFGVAAAGHANPRVVRAACRQLHRLPHAMGDVHPHALKAQLARELSRMTFERWIRDSTPSKPKASGPSRIVGKTIFCSSGFEAVEAALKTAFLATDRRGIVAFEGAYHGLGYGALNATHRMHFRGPFRSQLGRFGSFLPFPLANTSDSTGPSRRGTTETEALQCLDEDLDKLFRHRQIGAVLVEPIQARGGIRIPPVEFLPRLRRICDRHKVLLILDEIFTGFGRTGRWFACEHSGTVPDLVCLGKALAGGFPLSACVGRAELMDRAWPASTGEAIHTSTFLGHPVGCAMAMAQIAEIKTRALVERSDELGRFLLAELKSLEGGFSPLGIKARGRGLMAGIEVRTANDRPATKAVLRVVKEALGLGIIFLPEGESSNVISLTPPLTISRRQIANAVAVLAKGLKAASSTQD